MLSGAWMQFCGAGCVTELIFTHPMPSLNALYKSGCLTQFSSIVPVALGPFCHPLLLFSGSRLAGSTCSAASISGASLDLCSIRGCNRNDFSACRTSVKTPIDCAAMFCNF